MSFPFKLALGTGILTTIGVVGYASWPLPKNTIDLVGTPSPYLVVFAGDLDKSDSDFIAVINAEPDAQSSGEPVYSIPTGMTDSMPHHMEYTTPPPGEPLFMNAHHHEMSMVVDVSDLSAMKIQTVFNPPESLRFPHDYTRTPNGNRLVGFLRSDGESPDSTETLVPANHGGIAEYSSTGELLRTASAKVDTLDKAVRPYAFAMLPEIDRFVVTSAPMMETSWAEVLQIYRYSDFELLETIALPKSNPEKGPESQVKRATGFGPRTLEDGSVFLNTYECSFYHLSDIGSDSPSLKLVHTLDFGASGRVADHCGIPIRLNQFWIQPVGKGNSVVVLDIDDPQNPKQVFELETPGDFKPHWLAKDPQSNRLILGAELGGEQGFYVLRVDEKTGALEFDADFDGAKSGRFFRSKTNGYVSLEREAWPHGNTGDAWGHAALFMNQTSTRQQAERTIEDGEFLFAGACLPLEQPESVIQ